MRTFGIIEKLGGRKAVVALLNARGIALNYDTVRMWSAKDRGRIPGHVQRELIAISESKRIRITSADLMPDVITKQEDAA